MNMRTPTNVYTSVTNWKKIRIVTQRTRRTKKFTTAYLELASEINVDDLIAVIPNVEFFVRPNVKAVAIVSVFADDAPNGEVIDVHLRNGISN